MSNGSGPFAGVGALDSWRTLGIAFYAKGNSEETVSVHHAVTTRDIRRQVGFEEIAADLLQARFWITSGCPTTRAQSLVRIVDLQ
jgi:hypothetical protein